MGGEGIIIPVNKDVCYKHGPWRKEAYGSSPALPSTLEVGGSSPARAASLLTCPGTWGASPAHPLPAQLHNQGFHGHAFGAGGGRRILIFPEKQVQLAVCLFSK